MLHFQRTQKFEDTVITKIAAKLSTDLRYRKSQHCAAQFIVESFGNMINDHTENEFSGMPIRADT